MIRAALVAGVLSAALVGCGASSTKTVTKVVGPPPVSTSLTTSSTTSTTPSTTSVTTTSSTTSTTVAPTGSVLFQGVTSGGAQRPSTLELTGDGTLFVSGVQWSSWGGPTATGNGNAQYHGCTPNCAAAPSHTAIVSIRLSTIRVCSGRRYYSSLTLTLPSGKLLNEQFVQRPWSPC